ncbi:hypothetical protein [Thiomicrorhabdus sediminis]|uniref:Cytochrome C n=1 Tax=Thiomicrorhabdus sediminis TaxID=2580412 RepID=A0A4P9K6G0_9GAMM|nr:hypothetical protein [Thiomicrorhabdus sediminis]QCU90664.1 hypothetical protein FE785_08460 [Thiomicrorhabdus sediminis]
MKQSIYVVLCFLLLVPTSQALAEQDERQPIYLTEQERAVVLAEMRNFLEVVQQIMQGAITEDMQQVENAARPVGLAAMQGMSQELQKKLPDPFLSMGPQTHRNFQMIADDARDLGDPALTLEQLNKNMKNCIACHRAYRLEVAPKLP